MEHNLEQIMWTRQVETIDAPNAEGKYSDEGGIYMTHILGFQGNVLLD